MDCAVRRAIAETTAGTGRAPRIAQGIAAAAGPLRLRIDFVTPELAAAFSPAFAGATSAAAQVADDGEVWQITVASGSGGTPAPALVPAERGGDMRLGAGPEAYVLWMGRHAPTLYAVDLERRQALYWVEDAAAIPAWERSRPFLPILQVMLDATPWIAVHAAAIARDGGAVMLTGPGRAGKTTLALAALKAGWRYCGDDYVLLRTDVPEVAPLFATARLRDDMAARFPWIGTVLREVSQELGERRHELVLGGQGGGGVIGGAELKAMLLLDRRGAEAPQFGPATRTAVLSTLMANTLVATPGYEAARTAKVMRLLALLRPRRFDPGADFGPALDALAGELA
jgi:hypothetical protein